MNNYFNIYGALGDLGYGIFTRGLIKGLLQNSITEFSLNPIGNIDTENKSEEAALKSRAQSFEWRRHSPSVCIWHEGHLTNFSSNKLVAFPIFETTKFTVKAKSQLVQMDAIFVLTNWAKKVVEDNIGNRVPVFVVPGAGNLLEGPEISSIKKPEAFTFLNVGKLEARKATIEAIQAYVQTFQNRSEETRFMCHCFNIFDSNFRNSINGIMKALGLKQVVSPNNNSLVYTLKNAIVEIPAGRISALQVSQLYRYAHIGVFPARAEGWNLPLVEAIQSGLPCIASNYSAHTEYLTEANGYNMKLLLNNHTMGLAKDNIFFHGDRGNWADPSIEEISEKMVFSIENYSEISSSFDNSKIKETYTWKNTASKFINALESV